MSRRAAALLSLVIVSSVGCSGGERPTSDGPTVLGTESPRPTMAETLRRSGRGVARIATTTCDAGWGSGSGFLVGRSRVVTAAHVVADAASISVRLPRGVARGVVTGIDEVADVALLTLAHPVPGRILTMTAEAPRTQQRIGVIGYPLGLPLTTSEGRVTGLDRRVETETVTVEGLMQLSAAVDPGNSGGPVVGVDGSVTGLVSMVRSGSNQALSFAVPARRAAPLVSDWLDSPQAPRRTCDPDTGMVTNLSRHPDAPSIALALDRYFESIDSGEYYAAWQSISGDLRGGFRDVDSFAEEYSTTRIRGVTLKLSEMVDETANTADVSFTSTQDSAYGPDGQTCTHWNLRYTVHLDSGSWVIAGADALEPPRACN